MAYQPAGHGPIHASHSRRYIDDAYASRPPLYADRDLDRVPGEQRVFPKILAGVALVTGLAVGMTYLTRNTNVPQLGATPLQVDTEPGWQSMELTAEYSNAYAIYVRNNLERTASALSSSNMPAAPSEDTINSSSDVNTSPRSSNQEESIDFSGLSNVPRRDVPDLELQKSTGSPTDLNLDTSKGTTPAPADINPASRERPQSNPGTSPEPRHPSDVRDLGAVDNPY